jgi:hypothetical protein
MEFSGNNGSYHIFRHDVCRECSCGAAPARCQSSVESDSTKGAEVSVLLRCLGGEHDNADDCWQLLTENTVSVRKKFKVCHCFFGISVHTGGGDCVGTMVTIVDNWNDDLARAVFMMGDGPKSDNSD